MSEAFERNVPCRIMFVHGDHNVVEFEVVSDNANGYVIEEIADEAVE